jgi:hypothetical protein
MSRQDGSKEASVEELSIHSLMLVLVLFNPNARSVVHPTFPSLPDKPKEKQEKIKTRA